MKINDLVKELQDIQEAHGNIKVLWSDSEGNYFYPVGWVSLHKCLGLNLDGYGYPDASYVDLDYEALDGWDAEDISEEEHTAAPVVAIVSP